MPKEDRSTLHPTDPNYKRDILKEIRLFFYDGRTGKIMGRTPLRWCQLGLCYAVTYALLAGVTVGMFSVFYYYLLPVDIPKLIGVDSLLNGVPGVSKRPALTEPIYATTNMTKAKWVRPYIKDLDNYLKVHTKKNNGKGVVDCDDKTVLKKGMACKMNMTEMFPADSTCDDKNNYGYFAGQPCIAVKINRIYGWVPDLYNLTDLPPDFPKDRYAANRLPVKCYGSKQTDVDNLGDLRYIPENGGIPMKYFPYKGQKDYLDPFVFVQFLNVTPTLNLRIKCKIFARNIGYHYRVDISYTLFELTVDE